MKGAMGMENYEEDVPKPSFFNRKLGLLNIGSEEKTPREKIVGGVLGFGSGSSISPRDKVAGILGGSSKKSSSSFKDVTKNILGTSNKKTYKDKTSSILGMGTSKPKSDVTKIKGVLRSPTKAKYFMPRPRFNGIKGKVNLHRGLSPFKDTDKDGVINFMDCNPRNKNQQGTIHKFQNMLGGRGFQESTVLPDEKGRMRNYSTGRYVTRDTPQDVATTNLQDIKDVGSAIGGGLAKVGGYVKKGATTLGRNISEGVEAIDRVDTPDNVVYVRPGDSRKARLELVDSREEVQRASKRYKPTVGGTVARGVGDFFKGIGEATPFATSDRISRLLATPRRSPYEEAMKTSNIIGDLRINRSQSKDLVAINRSGEPFSYKVATLIGGSKESYKAPQGAMMNQAPMAPQRSELESQFREIYEQQLKNKFKRDLERQLDPEEYEYRRARRERELAKPYRAGKGYTQSPYYREKIEESGRGYGSYEEQDTPFYKSPPTQRIQNVGDLAEAIRALPKKEQRNENSEILRNMGAVWSDKSKKWVAYTRDKYET